MSAELNENKKTSKLIKEAIDICRELKNRDELDNLLKYDIFENQQVLGEFDE